MCLHVELLPNFINITESIHLSIYFPELFKKVPELLDYYF